MSMSALLQGTASYLETALALNPLEIEVRANTDGKPEGWQGGKYYYAIHPRAWNAGPSQGSQNNGIDEIYDIAVTLTTRIGRIPPRHRTQESYLKSTTGMESRVRAVIIAMTQGRYTGVLAAANALITTVDKIIEPLAWTGGDPVPRPVGPEWFNADGADVSAYGWIMSAEFSGARRVQNIDTMS